MKYIDKLIETIIDLWYPLELSILDFEYDEDFVYCEKLGLRIEIDKYFKLSNN